MVVKLPLLHSHSIAGAALWRLCALVREVVGFGVLCGYCWGGWSERGLN